MDTSTAVLLQAILKREGRSLLLYMAEAFPWASVGTAANLATLRQLVRDEASGVNALGQFLVRSRHTPEPLASYPADFTTLNFIDLNYLVPKLIANQKDRITELERDLVRVTDSPARLVLDRFLGVKRRNLVGLENLISPTSHSTAS